MVLVVDGNAQQRTLKMKRSADQIHTEVCGTCDKDLTDEGQEDLKLCHEVDELMFRCCTCDWWCDIDELCVNTVDDENTCENCNEEGQEEA